MNVYLSYYVGQIRELNSLLKNNLVVYAVLEGRGKPNPPKYPEYCVCLIIK